MTTPNIVASDAATTWSPAMLDALLAGETRSAPEWVRAQDPAQRAALRAAAEIVHHHAYDLLLRDVPAFMAFKTPDPPPPVDKQLFRSLIEGAITDKPDRVRAQLSPLPLNDLWAIIRICTAIQSAND